MVRLPYLTALTTLFSYGLLFAFGHFRDFFRRILDAGKSSNLKVRCAAPTLLGQPADRRDSVLLSFFVYLISGPGADAVRAVDP